jgi:hypothetical protein
LELSLKKKVGERVFNENEVERKGEKTQKKIKLTLVGDPHGSRLVKCNGSLEACFLRKEESKRFW